MTSPFDFINDINSAKTNLIRSSEDPKQVESEYNSYIINRGLSYFIDTILYANEMNYYHEIDSLLKNDYLINTIRSKKRYAKWIKKTSDDDLEIVKSYYGYSNEKARQALSILSPDQIQEIREKQEQGGLK